VPLGVALYRHVIDQPHRARPGGCDKAGGATDRKDQSGRLRLLDMNVRIYRDILDSEPQHAHPTHLFAVAAHPLLAIAFSAKRATASSSLLPLGAAFTVLAATYLAVQYMLAMKRVWFLIALGGVAVLEPILLLHASRHAAGFAAVVLAVQVLGAIVAFTLAPSAWLA